MKLFRFLMLAIVATLFIACEPTVEKPLPDNPTPEQPTPDDPTPEPEPVPEPEQVGNFFEIKDIYKADITADSVYAHCDDEITTYLICYGRCKTLAYIEDVANVRLSIEGYGVGEAFDIDFATSDKSFTISVLLYDKQYNVYEYKLSNENRDDVEGRFTLKDGVISLKLSLGDLLLENYFKVDAFRSVNECTEIIPDTSEDIYAQLFTPASVVLDNRDASTHYIYVSSKEGITTVEGMADAEYIVAYPSEGWADKLLKGNFVAGGSYPTMTITLNGKTYSKSDCGGFNCQFKAYDADRGVIKLNSNLYYSEGGGVALYYDGAVTLIE
ncbi:MAG: hypothetical protein E7126_01430 [Rikenellaceae bacterium]|nr:hypothetical protein [Rikenellaceae bacterium]